MPRSIRSFLPVVCLVSLVSVGALLRSARADEPDAETRFHDAYVLEVIDGKVADAAKAYLALVEDERTPPRIEGEARFRFAVCAALLGRPDESRARLASLVADPATSPDLQTRARTYLDALQGQEVGSEPEKKLQSLVFDLARAPLAGPDAVPPVYRDFEVLGDKAVPFLRGLLHHPDVTLRAHAFRLLCRMREPGMGAAWTPEIGVGSRGSWFGIDVTSYLNAQPNEKEAFEKNLLGRSDSEDASALRVLAGRADFHFSRETVRALAAREGVKELAPALLASPMGDGADLIRTWLEGDDPVLATAAAEQVYAAARNGAAKGPLPAPLPEVLAPVFREGWSHAYPTRETLGWLASAAPTSEVLDALAALLQAARSWSRPANTNPLYAYWGTSLQSAFGDRDLTPKEARTLGGPRPRDVRRDPRLVPRGGHARQPRGVPGSLPRAPPEAPRSGRGGVRPPRARRPAGGPGVPLARRARAGDPHRHARTAPSLPHGAQRPVAGRSRPVRPDVGPDRRGAEPAAGGTGRGDPHGAGGGPALEHRRGDAGLPDPRHGSSYVAAPRGIGAIRSARSERPDSDPGACARPWPNDRQLRRPDQFMASVSQKTPARCSVPPALRTRVQPSMALESSARSWNGNWLSP